MLAFVVLGLVFFIPSQELGLWKRLGNDLFCVEWDVKPAFSALTLLVGRQEGHPACEKLSGEELVWYLSGARCRLAYRPANATATHCLLLQ